MCCSLQQFVNNPRAFAYVTYSARMISSHYSQDPDSKRLVKIPLLGPGLIAQFVSVLT